jgi:signal peptidase I
VTESQAPGGVSDTPATPRRRWVAVLLSMLAPGLGQLYAGRPMRAVAMSLGVLVVTLLVFGSGAVLPSPAGLIVIALGMLLVPLYVVLDAGRIARVNPLVARRWWDRWYVYAGLVVLASIVWSPFLAFLKSNVLEAYVIPSDSMAPTILEGDYLLVTKLARSLERGRLAVHRREGRTFIKRIMGVPGDTLQMRDGVLIVNGQRIAEPYARQAADDPRWPEFAWQDAFVIPSVDRATYRPTLGNWGPLLVPAGSYFMLGDNRGDSLDSRFLGFIPVESIVGRPMSIYFSRDPETAVPRWSRIGMSLR